MLFGYLCVVSNIYIYFPLSHLRAVIGFCVNRKWVAIHLCAMLDYSITTTATPNDSTKRTHMVLRQDNSYVCARATFHKHSWFTRSMYVCTYSKMLTYILQKYVYSLDYVSQKFSTFIGFKTFGKIPNDWIILWRCLCQENFRLYTHASVYP